MNITWNIGLSAERARYNLKLKKNKKIKKKVSAQARKRPSLTTVLGYYKIRD